MFIPSEKATKIMIDLLSIYKQEDTITNALSLDYVYIAPEKFLENHFDQNDYDEEFKDNITEFFFRIMKYRKYLEAIALNFFKNSSGWENSNLDDMPTCIVFLYFLIIELNEYSGAQITKLLMSVNGKKALALLGFLKKKDILTKLYKWGVEIWDIEYVKSLLENIINEPMFQSLYETIKSSLNIKDKKKKKPLTVPVGPLCLSRPKKFVPKPESHYRRPFSTRIPILIRSNKIPNSTYKEPREIQRLELAKLKHKEEALELFWEAQKKAYRCANSKKSENYKAVLEKIEKERLIPPFKSYSSKEIKYKSSISPKKTATVILREGARLLKLEMEEIQKYEHLARGGFNTDLLVELEEEIRKEKFRQELEDIEKKRLECLISYEEALLAKQKCLKQKKESADEFKREKENWMKQLEAWKFEEQIKIREAFEKGKAVEKNAKEAVELAKEEKFKLALETMEESKALKEKRLKEREEDLQRKVQIIKEIKALHTFGEIKKKFSQTESGNLGLLCEMSLAELKERLFIMRVEVQEELERRKAEFKNRRNCRKEVIDSYQELIESHRQMAEEQKKILETDKREKRKEVRRCSSSIDDLRRQLYEKRRQRLKQ